MADSLLEIKNLNAGYGDIQVLRSLSLSLKPGERIGLFGPNGHGKTTLLGVISGLLTPWSGEIMFDGRSIAGQEPRRIVAAGIIQVPQGNILFPRMSVMENLAAGAFTRAAWARRKETLEQVFAVFPKLAERRRQLARTLSGGERQMLAIGAGLMARGRVLMLDEPTMGLSPLIREELAGAIDRIITDGPGLILVEQDFEFLSRLTNRFYLIEEGRVALEGDPADADNTQLIKMYFGGVAGAGPAGEKA